MRSPSDIARRFGGGVARAVRRGAARRALPRRGAFWVSLDVPSPLLERRVPHLVAEGGPSLLEILAALDAAAEEPRVEGVLLRLDGAPGGLARAQSLRRALDALRARGKAVAVWAESLDLDSLYVGSGADRLWIPPTGRVFAVGLRADAFYLRGLLDRWDVRPEVVRVGTHKSAAEMFTREDMSDEQREQLDAIVGDAWDVLVDGIAAGRGLDAARVRELVDRGPWSARDAVEVGLVDDCVYRDELADRAGDLASARAGQPGRPPMPDARVLLSLRGAHGLVREVPRLAYVVASGAIHRGRGPRGVASATLEALLERLRTDDGVRAVVVRVDSPGGDALASDLLWRAVRVLRREKPVVASLAEVAASGGYYLASAADALLAESSTLTGSIGVVGGKVDLSGLYARLGVGRDGVERGARAGMLSEARGFTDDEREAVRSEMRDLYETFLGRVAEGRGLAVPVVERAAEGRVWSGGRALRLGLVDALGGPLEALRDARRRAALRRDEPALLELHPHLPRLPLRSLLRWLG